MDKELYSGNSDDKQTHSHEDFMGIYNQLNAENRKLVEEMIRNN